MWPLSECFWYGVAGFFSLYLGILVLFTIVAGITFMERKFFDDK